MSCPCPDLPIFWLDRSLIGRSPSLHNPSVRLVLFGSVRFARAVKLEGGAQHKNHRVFSVSTGEELIAFSQKAQESWDLQYTISESHAIRLVGADIQVYRPAEWSKGIVDKLKVEGATSVVLSAGLNPSVAVFVAEKKVCQQAYPTEP